MTTALEPGWLVGVGLDERLCHEEVHLARDLGLHCDFWKLDRGWQCNWFHPDGSLARICTPQPSRREAFIFACAEIRGGLEFAMGDLEITGPEQRQCLPDPRSAASAFEGLG